MSQPIQIRDRAERLQCRPIVIRARPSAAVALAALILGVAAYLRFRGLTISLPHRLARPDEYAILSRTGDIARDLVPHNFIYPTFYLYVTWAWCAAWHRVAGWFAPVAPYLDAIVVAPAGPLLAGRALSALASLTTVALTLIVGWRLGGAPVGLVAGLLLAVNPLAQRDAHALKPDALLTLALVALVALVVRGRRGARAPNGWCVGCAVGACLSVKYFFVAGVLAYLAAVLEGGPGWRRLLPPRWLWLAAGAATAIFVVTSLPLFLQLGAALGQIGSNAFAVWGSAPPANPRNSDVTGLIDGGRIGWQSLDYHLTRSLPLGTGYLAVLTLLPGLVWALARGGRPYRFLAAAFLLYLLWISASTVRMARYLSPIVPVLALLLAGALARVADRSPSRLRPAVLAVLGLALAVEPAARAFAFVRIATQADTRVLASAYLGAHLPRGTRVFVLGTRLWPYGAPEVPPSLEVATGPARPGDVVVTHEHWLNFSHLRPGELERVAPCRRELAHFSPYGAGWAESLFEPADAFYVPLAGFRGVDRPGPVVTIWRIERCASEE